MQTNIERSACRSHTLSSAAANQLPSNYTHDINTHTHCSSKIVEPYSETTKSNIIKKASVVFLFRNDCRNIQRKKKKKNS